MNQLPNNTTLNPQKASLFGKTGIVANHNFDLEVISENHVTPASEVENDIYYYHTDHLGSSSWITYTDGSVTQHMQNLPPDSYRDGEPFIDQRTTSYDIRFKFTGKEMDAETGYQYFGARYYNSDISVWLSVDPMSDARLGLSPYNYSSWNPVMRVDPDGSLDNPIYDDEGNHLGNTKEGFVGEILIYTGDKKDIDFSKYSALESKSMVDVNTFEEQRSNMSSEALSNIYTNVLETADDVNTNNLYNGRISIQSNVYGNYNEPAPVSRFNYTKKDGQHRISVNRAYADELNTVEEIWSKLGIHEYNGHGINSYKSGVNHWRAYHNQYTHKTFIDLNVSDRNEIIILVIYFKEEVLELV